MGTTNLSDAGDTFEEAITLDTSGHTGFANYEGDEDWYLIPNPSGSLTISVLPDLVRFDWGEEIAIIGLIPEIQALQEVSLSAAIFYEVADADTGDIGVVLDQSLDLKKDTLAGPDPNDAAFFLQGTVNFLPAEPPAGGSYRTGNYYVEILANPDLTLGAFGFEASNRYLITTGNPTGQRSSNWGGWIELHDVQAQFTNPVADIISIADQFPNTPIPDELVWLDSNSQQDPGSQLFSPIISEEAGGGFEITVPGGVAEGVEWLAGETRQIAEAQAIAGLIENGIDFVDGLASNRGYVGLGNQIRNSKELFDELVDHMVAQIDLIKNSADISIQEFNERFQDNAQRLQNGLFELLGDDFKGSLLNGLLDLNIGVVERNSFQLTIAGPGGDFIGGSLDDSLLGGKRGDKIFGLEGNDNLVGFDGNDRIFGGPGDDTIYGNLHNDRLDGGSGDDRIDGGAGRDRINGGTNHDTLVGGRSNDTIQGGSGHDILIGGESELADIGLLITQGTLFSSNGVNFGKSGNDKLEGGGGNDILLGDDGNDRLIGGSGDDLLNGGSGIDLLVGGAGNDFYVINHESEIDKSRKDDGFDQVLSFLNNYTLGSQQELLFIGGARDKNGTGNKLNNGIIGNKGDNVLIGGRGDDGLIGNDGNDRLLGGKGQDSLLGGKGNDRLVGGKDKDRIAGEDGADNISGGGGRDRITGGNGNDEIRGRSNGDRIDGGNGNDFILGGGGKDRITGANGDDSLAGNGGADLIDGNNGDDSLIGGTGNDILNGGDGDDMFIFVKDQTDQDILEDFTTGQNSEDVIVLESFESMASFAEVQGAAFQSGANVVINLGVGEQLTLKNTTVASLHEDDFLFI